MATDRRDAIDEAFERIEETMLPSVAMMLDTLLDAASMARAGYDCEAHAAELRALASQLELLTRQLEAISLSSADPQELRAASRA